MNSNPPSVLAVKSEAGTSPVTYGPLVSNVKSEPSLPSTSSVKSEGPDDGDDDVFVPLAKRRAMAEQNLRSKVARLTEAQQSPSDSPLDAEFGGSRALSGLDSSNYTFSLGSADPSASAPHNDHRSLVDINLELEAEREKERMLQRGHKTSTADQQAEEERLRVADEEKRLIENINKSRPMLVSHAQSAEGVTYTESIKTGWRPPRSITSRSSRRHDDVREKLHILVSGDDIPPPIKHFEDLRLPSAMLHALSSQNMVSPTPIQVQGLPVLLSGRDMIGIAFTGSGKTLTFCLPMIALAFRAEVASPLESNEGPIGIVLCPSRELAHQTSEIIRKYCKFISEYKSSSSRSSSKTSPKLNTLLCMGGVGYDDAFRDAGLIKEDRVNRSRVPPIHMVVATPGRLVDMLEKRWFSLYNCIFLCLDEADRLLSEMEEQTRQLLDFFPYQKQTVLFSATMPQKVKEFALSALVKPIVVNVGHAGTANQNVVQEVEFVKDESKLISLEPTIQKTAPPVLIFASAQNDVDDVHAYLLQRGANVTAIHTALSQPERIQAVSKFKNGDFDILVASDIISKGIDFPEIQHVINYDMPKEIENYIHRIGRTGRNGKAGVATTFVNRDCNPSVLLDLKYVLKSSNQRIPPILAEIPDPRDQLGIVEEGDTTMAPCGFCGGFGHSILNCPKLRQQNKARQTNAFGYDSIEAGM